MSLIRYGQINQAERQIISDVASNTSEPDGPKKQSPKHYMTSKSTSYATKYNKNNLERSKQISSLQEHRTTSFQTARPVSKFCRISRYFDILQTPFSALENSLSHKQKNDTETNTSKQSDIVTVNDSHVSTKDHVDDGELFSGKFEFFLRHLCASF